VQGISHCYSSDCGFKYIDFSLIALNKTEQAPYEYLVQLISRYGYAMNPEHCEDKSLITDLPKLYSDALETHAAEQGGAIDSEITCTLLILFLVIIPI